MLRPLPEEVAASVFLWGLLAFPSSDRFAEEHFHIVISDFVCRAIALLPWRDEDAAIKGISTKTPVGKRPIVLSMKLDRAGM